jgi:hypothetical protein
MDVVYALNIHISRKNLDPLLDHKALINEYITWATSIINLWQTPSTHAGLKYNSHVVKIYIESFFF